MAKHPRHDTILANLNEVQAVAMTIWAEARAEAIEGEVAVGCVIRNRLLRPQRFADTWKGIVHARTAKQGYQFSCWGPWGGAMEEKNYFTLLQLCEDAMAGKRTWPPQQLWVAQGIVSGVIEDNTTRADHYYATYIKEPVWWKGIQDTVTYGVHRFGRERT
jgi:N-acetylmuramoyl-L-alanine amidase